MNGSKILTSPQDGQSLRNLERRLYVRFPRPVDPADFTFSLDPDPGGWVVTWGTGHRQVALKSQSPFTMGTRYRWDIRWEGTSRVVHFVAAGPSSLQLIDAAEEQGFLDSDTAWIYRLRRLHEPEKLPTSYQSAASIHCASSVWKRFKEARSSLKPKTIEQLKPYLVRPTHPDSYFNLKFANEAHVASRKHQPPSGFVYARNMQAPAEEEELEDEEVTRPENMFSYIDWRDKIRVWYRQGGRAKAQKAVDYLEDKRMYARFKKLMGVEPLSDAVACNPCASIQNPRERKTCRRDSCGGDGKIDIYLVPAGEPGIYDPKRGKSDHGWCREIDDGDTSAAFLLINREAKESPKNYFAATLAHELFHAFQDAWDAWEDDWWTEGSAVWAEDFIGPEWNTEQDYLPGAFSEKDFLLKTLTLDEIDHVYGIYLFPFHLSFRFGDEKIGMVWQDCGLDDTDALEAVELEVGDFKECFKEFALHTSDQGRYDGIYQDSGGPLSLWGLHYEDASKLRPEVKPIQAHDVKLPPLAAKYYAFKNECDPEGTPHIRFDLSELVEDDRISVQAIIEPSGRAEDQDWSDLEEKNFCINREDERFETIYLVITSHHEDSDFEGQFRIEMNAVECHDCYAYVTRTYDYEHQSTSSHTVENRTATVYMGFGPAVISGIASPSMNKQMIMYPFQSLEIAEGSAEYTSRSAGRTKRRSGRIVEAPMPDLPMVPVGDQMMPPIFLILYSDIESGRVTYAMLPDPDVKIIWNDGKEDAFDIGKVSQEMVEVDGMFGSMPLDGLVTAGDGKSYLAGRGVKEHTDQDSSSYEHSKETYTWKIFRRQSRPQ